VHRQAAECPAQCLDMGVQVRTTTHRTRWLPKSGLVLLPVTLFTHQNAAHGIVAGGCAGLAGRGCVRYIPSEQIHGDECRPRRRSWPRFPRTRSYPELLRVTGPLLSLVFRTEDVWQRYNQFIETAEFSIRVSPSHSYNAGRAGLPTGTPLPS
jgi:hypothetical protein